MTLRRVWTSASKRRLWKTPRTTPFAFAAASSSRASAARRREGLVGDDMQPRGDGLEHEGASGLRRRRDRHRINPARRDHRGEARVDRRPRQVGLDLGDGRGRAGDDSRELDTLGGGDERRVEVLPARAVSDQSDPHLRSPCLSKSQAGASARRR